MDIPNTGAIFTLGKSYLAENTQSYFYIKNDPVKRVISGPHQSAVICESGRLFVWGENHHGQLGIGGNNNQHNNNHNNNNNNTNNNNNKNNAVKAGDIVTKPTCVKSLKTLGLKVTDVAFGTDWAVILTHSNELFFSGRNIFPADTQVTQNFNATSVRGEECAIIRKPFRLEEFDDCLSNSEEEENYLTVLAGNEHFAVMTSSGRLLGWGSNASHQLGLAAKSEELAPLEIVLDAPIKQFTCGPESTLVLTASGNLYLTGRLNDLLFPQFTELQKNLAPNEEIIFMHISKASEIYIVTNAGVIYRSFESVRNKHLIFQRFYDYDSEENGPIWKLLRGFSFYTVLTKAHKFYTTFSESGHHLKTFREISKFKNLRLLDMAVGDQHILVHGIPRSSTLSATVGAAGEHRYMSRTFVMGDINCNVSRGHSGNKSAVLKEKILEEEQESVEKAEMLKKANVEVVGEVNVKTSSSAKASKVKTPVIKTAQNGTAEVTTLTKETTPKAKTPELKTPKAKTPEAKTPQVKTPEAKTPKAKTPQMKTPEVKTPEVKTPKVKTPEATEVKTPEVKTPEEKAMQKDDPMELTAADSNGNGIAKTPENIEKNEINHNDDVEKQTNEKETLVIKLGNLKLQKQSSIDEANITDVAEKINENSKNLIASVETEIATTTENAKKVIAENLENINEKIATATAEISPTKSIKRPPSETTKATQDKNDEYVSTESTTESPTKSIRKSTSGSKKESPIGSIKSACPASLKESPTKSMKNSFKDFLSPSKSSSKRSPTDSAKSRRSARSIQFAEEAVVEKHSPSMEKPPRPRTPYPDSSSASASVSTPPTTKKTLRNFSYEAAMEHDAIDNTTPMLHDSMENITENSSTDDEPGNDSAFKTTIKTPTPPYEEDEELRLEIETITDELDQTIVNEIRFINNGVDVTPSVEHKMQSMKKNSIEEKLEGKLEAVSEEVTKTASEAMQATDEKLNEKIVHAVDLKNELKQEANESKDSLTAKMDTKLQQAKDSMELTAQKVATGAREAVNTVGENATKAATGARDAVNTVGANAKQAANDTGDAIGALGHKAMDMASDAGHAIGSMGHRAMDAASDAKHAVGNAMTKVADNTKHAMDSMTSKITHQLHDAKENISSLVSTSNKNKDSHVHDNELDMPAAEDTAQNPPKTSVGEDDERTTASINSNQTSSGNPFDNNNPFESSNPFNNDLLVHAPPAPSYESGKQTLNDTLQLEVETKNKSKMRQFLSDMRSKSKGMSCRSEKSIRIEDEPPRYTPVEAPHNSTIDHNHTNGHNDNTSRVCTIL